MEKTSKKLFKIFSGSLDEFRDIRQKLHEIPELKFEEFKTAELVQGLMKSYGYEIQTGFGVTGFTAVLDSGKPGKVVGLRTELDCVAGDEKNGLPYVSKHKGRMHGCGHDGHMATILMIAKLLRDHKDLFKGKIKFIFQPAEEGGAGALEMIKDGVMENPKIDCVFAYHNMPVKKNTVIVSAGPVMAGSESFRIFFKGKGGHGAMPWLSKNPIFAATSFVNEMCYLRTQKDIFEPYVFSITRFVSGDSHNVIPDDTEVTGSLRYFSYECRDQILTDLKRILDHVCKSHEISYELEMNKGYPPTINHKKEADLVMEIAKEFIDDSLVLELENRIMGSEDFSFFLQQVPGCMFFMGNGEHNINHSTQYDFDDDIMPVAATTLAMAAIKWLNKN